MVERAFALHGTRIKLTHEHNRALMSPPADAPKAKVIRGGIVSDRCAKKVAYGGCGLTQRHGVIRSCC